MVLSCSPTNEEMEHIEAKSSGQEAGVIRPINLAPLMMGHERLHPGQSTLMNQNCFAIQKQKKIQRCCASHLPRLTSALA